MRNILKKSFESIHFLVKKNYLQVFLNDFTKLKSSCSEHLRTLFSPFSDFYETSKQPGSPQKIEICIIHRFLWYSKIPILSHLHNFPRSIICITISPSNFAVKLSGRFLITYASLLEEGWRRKRRSKTWGRESCLPVLTRWEAATRDVRLQK